MLDAASTAERFNAHEQQFPVVTKIEYTFDNRPEIEFSAARLCGAFLQEPGFTPASLMASKLSFECRINPRIQMADMIARDGMKDLDRKVGPVKFKERASKIALESSRCFLFFAIGEDDLLSERTRKSELEKDGFSEAAYHEWLRSKRAPDTWDNKVRFLKQFDAKRSR